MNSAPMVESSVGSATDGAPLVEVSDLRVYYGSRRRVVRAVDGVSFVVRRGETVGLVGESGCGKSTVARAILRLERISAGRILFEGQGVHALRGPDLLRFRRSAQMVFQDPYGSLNPRMTVGAALEEVLKVHNLLPERSARKRRVAEWLAMVGLDPAYAARYPHEFSGGQRQRIGIARALAVEPRFVIADEPVSALDVSVQVQILNLLKALKERLNLSYLFIAHDLAAVRYVAERVLVMYWGRIVETGGVAEVYEAPAHPYTRGLLAAVPDVRRALRQRQSGRHDRVLQGDLPSPAQLVQGCPFRPRCPYVQERCRVETPPLRSLSETRASACHFAEDILDLA